MLRTLAELKSSLRDRVDKLGGGLTLSWPLGAAGFRLQSTITLVPTSSWADVSASITTNGFDKQYDLPQVDPIRFYRLKKPEDEIAPRLHIG